MSSMLEQTKKIIIIECNGEPTIKLPWDLKTIFEYELNMEEIIMLESGCILENMNYYMRLEEEH